MKLRDATHCVFKLNDKYYYNDIPYHSDANIESGDDCNVIEIASYEYDFIDVDTEIEIIKEITWDELDKQLIEIIPKLYNSLKERSKDEPQFWIPSNQRLIDNCHPVIYVYRGNIYKALNNFLENWKHFTMDDSKFIKVIKNIFKDNYIMLISDVPLDIKLEMIISKLSKYLMEVKMYPK